MTPQCEDWLSQYSSNSFEFYGTDLCRLHPRLFSFFANLLQDRFATGMHHPGLSRASRVFFRERNAYDLPGGDGGTGEPNWDRAVTSKKAALQISRFSIEGQPYFSAALGTGADPLSPQSPDFLVLPMDERLEQYWTSLKKFREANPAKYLSAEKLRHISQAAGISEGDRLAVFDSEFEMPRMIQFAGRLLRREGDSFVTEEKLEFYISLPYGKHLSETIKKLTGITDGLLQSEGISEKEAAHRLQSFLQKARILCGHAVANDVRELLALFRRQKLDGAALFQGRFFADTELMAQRLFDLKNLPGLEKTAELAQLPRDGSAFHDARTDTAVTARIFSTLLPQYQERFGMLPLMELDALLPPQKIQLLAPLPDAIIPTRRSPGGGVTPQVLDSVNTAENESWPSMGNIFSQISL